MSKLWRHSFLNIPENVRGKIYAELLVVGEIRVSPSQITKVPGLAILRTCRQIHDEAAAVLYGNNSFLCCMQKVVPAQKAASNTQCPALPVALDWQTLPDPLNISGGVVFPAARYHRHISHLIIHIDVTIAHLAMRSSATPVPIFALYVQKAVSKAQAWSRCTQASSTCLCGSTGVSNAYGATEMTSGQANSS